MLNILPMTPGNRMLRIGVGQHEGRWFLRLDLWFFGIRLVNPWAISILLAIIVAFAVT